MAAKPGSKEKASDGSCWSGVIERLQAQGLQVRAPQFPLSSLADDVARLRQGLEFQDGPTIVVGHSYGGQIMTALGEEPRTSSGSSTSPRSGSTSSECGR
jgi:pimeloyl-ACP methyl ester carboxylesterase